MDEIRVGDAERSDALDRLGTLFADGYLDVGEFEERTGQAAVARTRGELSVLFDDLPAEPVALDKREPSEVELEEKLSAKRKLDTAIYTTLIGGLAVFFVLQIGLDLDYAWVVWPVMGILAVAWYTVFDISDEEDEILEELLEKERSDRAERLKLAAERRKELGKQPGVSCARRLEWVHAFSSRARACCSRFCRAGFGLRGGWRARNRGGHVHAVGGAGFGVGGGA